MLQLGIDRLAAERCARLQGRRVGLLCHAASVASDFRHLTELCVEAGVEVVRCFGPEHGIWADAQDMAPVDGEAREPVTGAPVSSLYGDTIESLTPPPESLEGIELLVIDLQDIGTRYYTYLYTAALVARRCAERSIPILLLDRPNPLGGEKIEGPMIEPGFESFVGLWSLPMRHGLTIGEALTLLNEREGFGAEIEILEVQGWQRSELLIETGQRWVNPSPNMPRFSTAILYPGLCLIEGTELSEGRGTTLPFEQIGGRGLDPFRWAALLNAQELPGISFRPLFFQPTFQKHAGERIGGVALHVTDPHTLQPVRVGLQLLATARRLAPEALQWRRRAYEFVTDRPAIDLLFGSAEPRELIDAGGDVDALWESWRAAEEQFRVAREPFLRYR